MAGSSVSVVVSSLLLKRYKRPVLRNQFQQSLTVGASTPMALHNLDNGSVASGSLRSLPTTAQAPLRNNGCVCSCGQCCGDSTAACKSGKCCSECNCETDTLL